MDIEIKAFRCLFFHALLNLQKNDFVSGVIMSVYLNSNNFKQKWFEDTTILAKEHTHILVKALAFVNNCVNY